MKVISKNNDSAINEDQIKLLDNEIELAIINARQAGQQHKTHGYITQLLCEKFNIENYTKLLRRDFIAAYNIIDPYLKNHETNVTVLKSYYEISDSDLTESQRIQRGLYEAAAVILKVKVGN